MKFPFNWYNKFGTLPSSYREAMSYEEQILWLCQQIENLKLGTANYNYNLLENKPSINGVTLQGNVTSAQLGIDLNYNFLMNKPSINGITLLGNKTLSDLDIQQKLVAGTGIRINGNIISATGGGGGGGTGSYADLEDKPQINGFTLHSGNNASSSLGLQKTLDFEYVLNDYGSVLNMSSYQLTDLIPQHIDSTSVSNSGYIFIPIVSETTELKIYGNFDLYSIDKDNYLREIYTTENRVNTATHIAQYDESLVINFYDLDTYQYYVREIYNGYSIRKNFEETNESQKLTEQNLNTFFSANFPISEIPVSSDSAFFTNQKYYGITKDDIGFQLPTATTDLNACYLKIPKTENYANHFVIKGKSIGIPIWFTTKSTDAGEVITSVSDLNFICENYETINFEIPNDANYIYIQFTNTDTFIPRVFAQKITTIGGGTTVTKLTSNLVLEASTPLTLDTGFYQTIVDANNNYGVYFHTATIGNLILGGNELFYFDNTSQTLIFENKNYFYDTYETDWLIEEHTNITNEILNDRNKIPTSQAVYNALQNSGTFYTTLTSTLTLNLDGTNSQNLTDGYYLTDLVQYYDDNGLQTASYLSYNFCYYNASQKRLTLTGLQKGLTYYDTFARYIDSTNGWLYSYKQFVNVLDNSKISTSISSSSTNSEVAGALACYEASIDKYATTEHVVGTWTDGKPLYEKTITGTVPSAASDGNYATTNIAHNIANPKIIFGTSKFIYPTSATFSEAVDLPYFTNSNYQIKCSYSPTNVVITNGVTHYNGFNARITIRYTKTTD